MKSLKVEWPEWLNQPFLRSRRRRYKRRCTLTCTAHFVGPPELMNWFSWMRRWRKKPGWFPKLDISYYLLGDFSDSLFMFWLQLWHNIHLYPLNLKNPFCGPLPNKTSPSKTVYPKKTRLKMLFRSKTAIQIIFRRQYSKNQSIQQQCKKMRGEVFSQL